MPRPFPFPIHIGTDLCHIPRIFDILLKRPGRGEAFTTKLLTSQELSNVKVNRYVLGPLPEFWRARRKLKNIILAGEKILEGEEGDLAKMNQIMWKQSWHVIEKKDYWDMSSRNRYNGILHLKNSQTTAVDGHKSNPEAVDEQDSSPPIKVDGTEVPMTDVSSKPIASSEGTRSPNGKPSYAEEMPSEIIPQLSKLWLIKNKISEQHDENVVKLRRGAEFLAGRFAAKEAAIKAHRSRRLTFHDIIIMTASKGAQSAAPVAHILPQSQNWDDAQIVPMSISHDGQYATAVCLSHEPA